MVLFDFSFDFKLIFWFFYPSYIFLIIFLSDSPCLRDLINQKNQKLAQNQEISQNLGFLWVEKRFFLLDFRFSLENGLFWRKIP